ncbi:hypothetical protein MP638_007003 [Amoeboaphelidium occidentale]|nr:hypothetical protein MP638_007003 [Amoeboaphelidium occidentale]
MSSRSRAALGHTAKTKIWLVSTVSQTAGKQNMTVETSKKIYVSQEELDELVSPTAAKRNHADPVSTVADSQQENLNGNDTTEVNPPPTKKRRGRPHKNPIEADNNTAKNEQNSTGPAARLKWTDPMVVTLLELRSGLGTDLDELRRLIPTWCDNSSRNGSFNSKLGYETISMLINKEYGTSLSGEQCKNKIKNLQSEYREIERRLLGSGPHIEMSFILPPYYDTLDAAFSVKSNLKEETSQALLQPGDQENPETEESQEEPSNLSLPDALLKFGADMEKAFYIYAQSVEDANEDLARSIEGLRQDMNMKMENLKYELHIMVQSCMREVAGKLSRDFMTQLNEFENRMKRKHDATLSLCVDLLTKGKSKANRS